MQRGFAFYLIILSLVVVSRASGIKTTVLNDGDLKFETYTTEKEFCCTVVGRTLGYMGFGITDPKNSTKSDVVICGVDDDTKTAYAFDYVRTHMGKPKLDEMQNVRVVYGVQNSTYTTVEFCKPMYTDDPEDVNFEKGEHSFIWSCGQTDTLAYHGDNKGRWEMNIFE